MLLDVTAIYMGDPAARWTREPTTRERERRPVWGEWTSVWSELEVGERMCGLTGGRASDGRNWLRKRGRDGRTYRMVDGTYDLVRTV